MWCPVGIPFKRDRGDGDDRCCSKSLFQIVVLPFAVSQAKPPPTIMDHDGDVVRVGERCRRASKCGIIHGRIAKEATALMIDLFG